ncbi:hypothetical protein [Bartonella sp. HY038]|nr:hypothetical protein [Bartonella sp. HY038]
MDENIEITAGDDEPVCKESHDKLFKAFLKKYIGKEIIVFRQNAKCEHC